MYLPSITGQTNRIDDLKNCNDKVYELERENKQLRDTIINLYDRIRELEVQSKNGGITNSSPPNTARDFVKPLPPSPNGGIMTSTGVSSLRREIDEELTANPNTLPKPFRLFGKHFNTYVVDLYDSSQIAVEFFWKDPHEGKFHTFSRIKDRYPQKNFLMLTNGGMFNKQVAPQGLYVENGQEIKPLDRRRNRYGNFYMQPNGIFLIDQGGVPHIVRTEEYKSVRSNVKYATQSGPMLLHEGKINRLFRKGSSNERIRSGVGIIGQNRIVFVISKEPVCFYDFAAVFRDVFGCNDALFLDGQISKMYCPDLELYNPSFGNFGVMIGVIQK